MSWTTEEWLAAERTDLAALNLYVLSKANGGKPKMPDVVERPGEASRVAAADAKATARAAAHRRRVADRAKQLQQDAEEVTVDGG